MDYDLDKIILEMKSASVSVARSAIFKVSKYKLREKIVIELLTELLDHTNDSIRDAAAISLGDLEINEAGPKIIDRIDRAPDKENIGSLLYALENLDTKDYFIYFIHHMINGILEVREEASIILEKNADIIDFQTKLEAIKLLKEARN